MTAHFTGWRALVAVAAQALPGTAFAVSDVSNSGGSSRQATTSVAAPIASSQTASLISGAIGGGFVTPGGAGGGFAPSGGGTGANGQQGSSLPFMSTRGMAGGGSASKFGVWTQGTYSRIDKSESGLEMTGNVYNAVVGTDYKITDRYMVGVALSWEHTDLDTVALRARYAF